MFQQVHELMLPGIVHELSISLRDTAWTFYPGLLRAVRKPQPHLCPLSDL